VRAVVLGERGEPELAEIAEPEGAGQLVRIHACGLCGSDVEKIGVAPAGTVLGHEIVAETADGRLVALVHHASCGTCDRCRAGHESTCEAFSAATITPGGFAERARARAWVDAPADLVGVARATMVEPLACVLRGAVLVPRGRVLVVGHGFIGRLFAAVLERRGNEVFAVDADPRRAGRPPDGAVQAAILCGRGGVDTALDALEPGGTVLVFADAGAIPSHRVYRGELTVVGTRSATPRFMEEAAALLPELRLPEPVVLPLERFAEGLELHRRRDALKVVFTP
jgi:L-iditol 2-dehydrogenase